MRTPWAAGPVDWFWAQMGEYGVGIGEANLAFSFITYTGSAIGCGLGLVH